MKRFAGMVVAVAGMWALPGWADLVIWDFAASGPSPSTALPTHIAGGVLTNWNPAGTVEFLSRTAASSGYAAASGGTNAALVARTGPLQLAEGGSAAFELTFTVDPGFCLSLESWAFGSRSTSTGPQAYSLRTSVDGYDADWAGGMLVADSAWHWQAPATTTLSAPPGETLTLRLYGSDGIGTPNSGQANWRLDDLQVGLSAVPAAVPEPARLGLLLLALAGGWRWRRLVRRPVRPPAASGVARRPALSLHCWP